MALSLWLFPRDVLMRHRETCLEHLPQLEVKTHARPTRRYEVVVEETAGDWSYVVVPQW